MDVEKWYSKTPFGKAKGENMAIDSLDQYLTPSRRSRISLQVHTLLRPAIRADVSQAHTGIMLKSLYKCHEPSLLDPASG